MIPSYNRLPTVVPIVLGLICGFPVTASAQSLAETAAAAESAAPAASTQALQEAPPPTEPALPFGLPPLEEIEEIPATEMVEPATTQPRGSLASTYVLGPGDLIDISVYGYDEYTGSTSVLPDGSIVLPIIGNMSAAGKTADQLTQDLRAALNRILVEPSVSVTLSALRPVVINVAGEVYRPGPLELQETTNIARGGGGNNNYAYAPPSLSRALVEAGGIKRTADLRDVTVIREMPNGNVTRSKVNLWDALWSATLPEDMLLRDGDTVFVPKLAEGEALVDNRLLATSSLAPDTVRVRVVGEVTSPGEVAVPPNSSLSSAVAIAGGPTDDARLKTVAFVRMDDTTGEVLQEEVDLRNLIDDYQVQDGDVIVVPKTRSGSVLDLAARLVNPFNFLFRIFDNNN
ncbi:polysaccharide biosynthesis/export family protein [Leptothoe kymatousa]|uniref:Polysaccharide biosynthesis/export family protein n=1 Tax=Leptothoe kymatousa TAU-MAC 1615 TaxID=2364775 RepID=A0ABS5XZX3_9CYAN|nr:polysaccharide biosynthesis/export family protein [Leptothoe kymatousa]MBT9311115.1 polysaccharide biosynthesis/export family protein [Leptothoe kymatousa TAU-MAC 1615]